MKKNILVLAFVLAYGLLIGQALPKTLNETDFCIGKSLSIQSVLLNEARDLNIYLPPSYSQDSLKRYPVIYLLDGSADEDFIHISGIVQFGSFSWINMIPESIVVGIGNVDRVRDFTYPSQNELDLEEFPSSGKSGNFIAFLENELQHFIDSSFRTSPTKTLIGQSLGGLLATEILFKKPELFDNYIIVSPSLWWDDEKLIDVEFAFDESVKSVYIAGGKEGEVMERTARELFDWLSTNKHQSTRLFYDFLEEKSHGDALHLAVYHAFEKIFESNLD